MYLKIEKWLNSILEQEIPDNVIAFNFNLYENADFNWSIELVGTECFDLDDEDWTCNEVTDFGTRDNPLSWHREATWDQILEEVVSAIEEYLNTGMFASILKKYDGIGAGFVDGDIEILYTRGK